MKDFKGKINLIELKKVTKKLTSLLLTLLIILSGFSAPAFNTYASDAEAAPAADVSASVEAPASDVSVSVDAPASDVSVSVEAPAVDVSASVEAAQAADSSNASISILDVSNPVVCLSDTEFTEAGYQQGDQVGSVLVNDDGSSIALVETDVLNDATDSKTSETTDNEILETTTDNNADNSTDDVTTSDSVEDNSNDSDSKGTSSLTGEGAETGHSVKTGDGEEGSNKVSETVIVSDEEGTLESGLLSESATITIDGKSYTLLMSGLTNLNDEATIAAITDYANTYLNGDVDATVKLINDSYVDAEKYDVNYTGFDSNHCWAGTISNMLTLAGWNSLIAQAMGDTLATYMFEDEDSLSQDGLMAYFEQAFTDDAGEPVYGIDWLFDGIYFYADYPQTVAQPTKNTDLGSIDTQTLTSVVEKSLEAVNEGLDVLNVLSDITDTGIGLQLKWLNSDGEFDSEAHYLTAIGTIIDDAAENIADKFKAIILADSDNDGTLADGATATSEVTSEEAYTYKAAKTDSYTIYKLSTCTDKDGNEYWCIDGYLDGFKAVIGVVESIPKLTSEILATITETEGTQNANEDINLVWSGVELALNNDSGQNSQEADENDDGQVRDVNSLAYTDELYLNYKIMNYSNKNETEEVEFPLVVDVYDSNNELVLSQTFTSTATFATRYNNIEKKTDISSILSQLPVGTYTLTATLNPSDAQEGLTESYYIDNKVMSMGFAVAYANPDLDTDDKDDPESDDKNQDDNKDTNVQPVTVSKEQMDGIVAYLSALYKAAALPKTPLVSTVVNTTNANSANSNTANNVLTENQTAIKSIPQEDKDKIAAIKAAGSFSVYTPTTYYSGEDGGYISYVNNNADSISEIIFDGLALSSDDYELYQGDDGYCRITLKKDFLDKQKKKYHKISVSYKDSNENVSISFTIK